MCAPRGITPRYKSSLKVPAFAASVIDFSRFIERAFLANSIHRSARRTWIGSTRLPRFN